MRGSASNGYKTLVLQLWAEHIETNASRRDRAKGSVSRYPGASPQESELRTEQPRKLSGESVQSWFLNPKQK